MGRPRLYFTDEEKRLAHNRATTRHRDKIRGGLPKIGDRAICCSAGHRWNDRNSYIDGRGIRHCHICNCTYRANARASLKLEVLSHYGHGKLQCAWPGCNVVDVDMLSLDHINNDGGKERKLDRNMLGMYFT